MTEWRSPVIAHDKNLKRGRVSLPNSTEVMNFLIVAILEGYMTRYRTIKTVLVIYARCVAIYSEVQLQRHSRCSATGGQKGGWGCEELPEKRISPGTLWYVCGISLIKRPGYLSRTGNIYNIYMCITTRICEAVCYVYRWRLWWVRKGIENLRGCAETLAPPF